MSSEAGLQVLLGGLYEEGGVCIARNPWADTAAL
jgi:hypothetical protein